MNSIPEVQDWLRSRPGRVRLVGSGSRSHTLPAAPEAAKLDLSGHKQILRLDPGDQTCTVECGLPRSQLDAALAEVGLELPCLGDGTIGGLFASDGHGPAAAGCLGPRNLLLGVEALLADGTAFKSGAKVVKSVAGFDVHKLLVGSHGRLFVAMQLHLRLKPRPRAEQWFDNANLTSEQALQLLASLNHEEQPPTLLQVRRDRDGSHAVCGRVTGRAVHVTALCRRHALQPCAPRTVLGVDVTAPDAEVLAGITTRSALPKVLATLPANAPFVWLGGGRFETALPDATTSDEVLRQLPQAGATAMILTGAANRRGVGTPLDPGEQQLANGLKQALDPDGILV